jgi:hypothetical protein
MNLDEVPKNDVAPPGRRRQIRVDPGEWYERWHKSDHQGSEPYKVPELYFFYPSPQESNYFVDIDSVAELKFEAGTKQVSQFEPAVNRCRPEWDAKDLEKAKKEMREEQPRKDGHSVEAFRYATGFVQY